MSSSSPDLPPGVTVIDHPLIRARLTRLRDADTGHEEFRRCLHEISRLMIFEVTRGFETRPIQVRTPLGHAPGFVPARPIVLVPILRAGLGMLRGLLHVLPEARIGHIGMFRNERTLMPETYYFKLPPNIAEAEVILIDPMLATGNSSADAARRLAESGAAHIHFLSLISAPEGVACFRQAHPRIPIFTAALDEGLDDRGYIVPGLGDAGDRYFGTD